MGAAESPNKKRRHDGSRERLSSRDNLAPQKRACTPQDNRRSREHSRDPARSSRPADTKDRREPLEPREKQYIKATDRDSQQAASPLHRGREDSRHLDRSRDRSRERHTHREQRGWHMQDGDDPVRHPGTERHRDRDKERDRDRDRDRDRGRHRDRKDDWGDNRQQQAGRAYDSSRHGHGGDIHHHASDSKRRDRADHPSSSTGGRGGDGDSRSRHLAQEEGQEQLQGPPKQHHRSNAAEGAGSGQRAGQEQIQGKPKWGKPEDWATEEVPPPGPPKEGPNLGLSGKLAAETNKTADGSSELKFQPPAEARVCKKPVWKLFVYKGDSLTADPIGLTQMPFYLFGKDRKVADIPTDHPSCSRQHAVVVFREVETDAPDGIGYVRTIKPYLLDLETTNGTSINKERLESARYYEVLHGDVIRFGFSSRDYVMMNEALVN